MIYNNVRCKRKKIQEIYLKAQLDVTQFTMISLLDRIPKDLFIVLSKGKSNCVILLLIIAVKHSQCSKTGREKFHLTKSYLCMSL